MKMFLALVVLVVVAVVFFLLKAKPKRPELPKLEEPEVFPYTPKPVMTEPEQILYFRLVEALPDLVVLAQVQMSSFLKLKGRQANWRALSSRIREKSCDFLVLRKDSSVIAAIELQDASHDAPDRQKSDEFKRKALGAAGVKLVEFNVSALPSGDEIRARINASY